MDTLNVSAPWSLLFEYERACLCLELDVAPENVVLLDEAPCEPPAAHSIDLLLGVTAYPPPVAWTRRLEALGYVASAGDSELASYCLVGDPMIRLRVAKLGGARWRGLQAAGAAAP